MNVINIIVAGIRFQIRLYPQEFPFYPKDFLVEMLRYYFAGFITYEKSFKHSFIIDIVDDPAFFLFTHPAKSKNYCSYLFAYLDKKHIQTTYSISMGQFMIMFQRVLISQITKNHGFIIHASSAIYEGKCILFLGKSGAGKSTAVSLAHPVLNAFTDDLLIIIKESQGYHCYQTPFVEKENWIHKKTIGYPIGTVFKLVQSEKTHIGSSISNKEKIDILKEQLMLVNQDKASQKLHLMIWAKETTKLENLYFEKNRKDVQKVLLERLKTE